jgi:GTP-binding protein HflX
MSVRPRKFQSSSEALSNHAIAIAVQLPEQTEHDVAASLAELAHLAATLGIEVTTHVVQRRTASSGTYFGEGKLREVVELVQNHPESPPLVIADGELTPSQARALELALQARVLDRTALILRIFEKRAQTQRARLEVEIARLIHELPRVRDDETVRDKQGGGAGRGEQGHTAVEMAKQQMRDRLAKLKRELSALQDTADHKRKARGNHANKRDAARIALVGYTNAGKSSLMRALTGSEVLVEDKLFATLSVTTRPLLPATSPPVLLTDTVGFIQRLPHELVASFRSTLDEARDAERLLLIVDVSDPAWRQQLRVTQDTLESIGVRVEQRIVLNKIDRVRITERLHLAMELPDALQICAHDPEDIAELRAAILASVDADMSEAVLQVPYAKSGLTAEIKARGRVVEERYEEDGSVLRVRARAAAIERWKATLVV